MQGKTGEQLRNGLTDFSRELRRKSYRRQGSLPEVGYVGFAVQELIGCGEAS